MQNLGPHASPTELQSSLTRYPGGSYVHKVWDALIYLTRSVQKHSESPQNKTKQKDSTAMRYGVIKLFLKITDLLFANATC